MISFIIPAYNEEALIGRTIAAIRTAAEAALNGQAYEIIVADDASTDRTAAIAQEAGARVVSVHKRQIAAVRNAGAHAANGDVLIFVDADTLLPECTLRAALEALACGAIGGGSAVRFDGSVPLVARLILPPITLVFRLFRYAAGCFIFCRRDSFVAVGGFDERFFASEEVWFSKAMKRQGRFVVLREHVISSGRKLRQNSTLRVLGTLAGLAVRGPKAVQRREGLDLWYDGRRETSPPEA